MWISYIQFSFFKQNENNKKKQRKLFKFDWDVP